MPMTKSTVHVESIVRVLCCTSLSGHVFFLFHDKVRWHARAQNNNKPPSRGANVGDAIATLRHVQYRTTERSTNTVKRTSIGFRTRYERHHDDSILYPKRNKISYMMARVLQQFQYRKRVSNIKPNREQMSCRHARVK